MRMNWTRQDFLPPDAVKVADKQSDAVAYLYETNGAPCAAVFHGRAQKPDWQYRFKTKTRREARIAEFFQARRGRAAYKAKMAAERKAAGRGLEVGDICSTSWGYEQTNVEFYQVTALIGATMIEARQIGQTYEQDGHMSGKTRPKPDQFVGAPFRARAERGRFKAEYAYASKETRNPDGTWPANYTSNYH